MQAIEGGCGQALVPVDAGDPGLQSQNGVHFQSSSQVSNELWEGGKLSLLVQQGRPNKELDGVVESDCRRKEFLFLAVFPPEVDQDVGKLLAHE